MPQQAVIFRILVASPSDCIQERKVIPEVIYAWNAAHSLHRGVILEPVLWETHSRPELGDRPQGILNKQIVGRCDILIGAFWTRLGTHTGRAESGTAEEIEEFRKAGKPVLLYFSSAPVIPESIDLKQYAALTDYRKKLEADGIISRYESIADLREQLHRHLSSLEILRGSVSENSEPEPNQQQTALTAFKQEFESFRRRLAAEWQIEKASDPVSIDDGKYILSGALSELMNFIARIERDKGTRLSELLSEAAQKLKQTQRHKLVLDAGVSSRKFWELGDQCLDVLDQVRVELDRVEEQLSKGEIEATMSDEQLEIIKILADDRVQELTVDDIAAHLSVPTQKVHYFLDKLLDEEYIIDLLAVGSPARYKIARRGREFLVEKGLL